MTRSLFVAAVGVVAIAVNPTASSAQTASAQRIDVPQRIEVPLVPAALEVPQGNVAFLEGAAIGTQNYVCLPASPGFKWTFTSPQATLYVVQSDERLQQIATHFLSANPIEGGTLRPTWQHSSDSSAVWGKVRASSTDLNYVENGAIPWLLVEVAGSAAGATDGSSLTRTTFIQRVNTSGGLAPATGCAQASDVGNLALVPYSTNYVFYRAGARR
jgi:hypothetical protein